MNPPTYPEPPSYSSRPSRGEERLLINTRTVVPNGTFIKESATFTLVLRGQEDGTERPCYGRSASIGGALNIKQTENITLVTLKFSGVVEVIGSEFGRVRQTILQEDFILWSSSGSDGQLGLERDSLPFSLTLPADYSSGTAKPHQLPPSLTFHDDDLTACVHYSITAKVTRQRRLQSILGSSDESLFVEMEYRPRSRPAKPLTNASFLSSVKQVPEAWYQTQGKFSNLNSSDPQIICDFFVPEGRIFGLADSIPFHIQLSSKEHGLADFLPPSYHSRSRQTRHGSPPSLKVELLRQIVANDMNGHKSWTNVSLGEGYMSQLLPSEAEQLGLPVHGGIVHLHWQGTVMCRPDVRVPSFHIGHLVFKDFITLSIVPGKEGQRFRPFKLPVSITFVTDSWIGVGSRDIGSSTFAT